MNAVWLNAHRRFHAACPSTTMLDTRQRLFDEAELYRHWSARGAGSKRNIVEEHSALLGAALHHDPVRAADLVRVHIEQTAHFAVRATQGCDPDDRAAERATPRGRHNG